MKHKDEEFRIKLLDTFAVEAKEHLQALSSRLLELEKSRKPDRMQELLEAAFREAHSLKGAARAVDAAEIESVCQALESVFAGLKGKEFAPSAALLDTLHDVLNLLEGLLTSQGKAALSDESSRVAEVTRRLEAIAQSRGAARPREPQGQEREGPPPAQPTAGPGEPAPAETVRISAAKLDRLLLQAEELLSARLMAGHRALEAQEIHTQLNSRRKRWTRIQSDLRVLQHFAAKHGGGNGQLARHRELRNVLEFLEQERAFNGNAESALGALAKSIDQDARTLARTTESLLEETKRLRMLPFSSLLEGFPRLIRNLSRERNKEVDLESRGGEIEIDRRILEEMKDPFIHLLRNCIDHGIEPPEQRVQSRKPRRGTITLAITQNESNRVEITISDDGSGIDASKVLAAARKRGVALKEDEAAIAREPLTLIFESGVSTSPIITDISGRGLGLAIARERVEKLGGIISVETHPGQGTTFRILLPLSVATFRGVLVRVRDRMFVLPLADIERIVRARAEEIHPVENRETIQVRGETVALVRLADVLDLPRTQGDAESEEKFPVAVVRSAGKRLGLRVDEVVGEQEVLVKDLGPQLLRVRNVSGATVLGTGQVTPILNTSDLLKSAMKVTSRPAIPVPPGPQEERRRKAILVVEDSITARTLLKNILEAAGYAVETAVDGVDAFTLLKTAEFDLVVSDVDMPRMNGLDLTARIRAEQKLAELPVILVTALESRDDRERGIDVGANAYIVKSSFEQSNLLEVVRQLL